MSQQQWKIRPAQGSDLSFIYATWLRSYQCDSPLGASFPTTLFFRAYSRVIDQILSYPDTTIRIACLPENEEVILGYAVSQGERLHYVFVKKAFKRNGIARSLIEPLLPHLYAYTHRTKSVTPVLAHCKSLQYEPFDPFLRGEALHAAYQESAL